MPTYCEECSDDEEGYTPLKPIRLKSRICPLCKDAELFEEETSHICCGNGKYASCTLIPDEDEEFMKLLDKIPAWRKNSISLNTSLAIACQAFDGERLIYRRGLLWVGLGVSSCRCPHVVHQSFPHSHQPSPPS